MRHMQDERGFSMVEILVAMAAFSLVSFAFLSVMLSASRGTDSTGDSVRIAEEARLGLNRMVRDTREAGWVSLPGTDPAATYNSFTVRVDYNGDGGYSNSAAGVAEGNYEIVTYAYDEANDRITLTAEGVGTETLIRGVDCVRVAGACKSDIFSFTSNRLEYDWDADGVTTLGEVNQAACAPNNLTTLDTCNGSLVDKELANLTSVNFAFRITTGGRSTAYYAEAQLRNRR